MSDRPSESDPCDQLVLTFSRAHACAREGEKILPLLHFSLSLTLLHTSVCMLKGRDKILSSPPLPSLFLSRARATEKNFGRLSFLSLSRTPVCTNSADTLPLRSLPSFLPYPLSVITAASSLLFFLPLTSLVFFSCDGKDFHCT